MNAKRLCEFTIDCGPGTLWKVRVVIWPTLRTLHRERNVGIKSGQKETCDAFCRQFGWEDAWTVRADQETNGYAAEIHFYRRALDPSTIAHEAVHATVAYAKLAKLDLSTSFGDEAFAASVSHIFEGIMWGIQEFLPRKRKRKTARGH